MSWRRGFTNQRVNHVSSRVSLIDLGKACSLHDMRARVKECEFNLCSHFSQGGNLVQVSAFELA